MFFAETRLILGLLAASASEVCFCQCVPFPASYTPFASVAYVAGPNSKGDSLVVGALAGSNGLQQIQNVALPPVPNTKFCDANVVLAQGKTYVNVYVPTAAERMGQFPDFAGLLTDPDARSQPFPGGIIPISRLGSVFAWRIGAQEAPKPEIFTGGIINASGDKATPPASPGSLISIYGRSMASALASATLGSDGKLLTQLNGTQVRIGSLNAPLLYVSPSQINAQVPFELTPGRYSVTVLLNGASSTAQNLTVTKTSPGVFAAVKNADYSVVGESNPAKPGDVLVLYCTGFGAVSPAVASGALAPSSPLAYPLDQPAVSIDGLLAKVVNAVLSPGFVGLYQAGIIVPDGLASGHMPIIVSIGGASTGPGSIPISGARRAGLPQDVPIPTEDIGPIWFRTTDWNRDGRAEIMTYVGTTATFAINRGSYIYENQQVQTQATRWQDPYELGDVNNDGIDDLLAVDPYGSAFYVYLGQPDGSYQRKSAGVTLAQFLGLADTNGDRLLDVTATNSQGQVQVFLGKGDGTFQPGPVSGPVPTGDLLFADVTGDGVPDLISCEVLGNGVNITIYAGDGAGKFQLQSPTRLPGITKSYLTGASIAVGDANGDGLPDIFVAYSSSDGLWVRVNLSRFQRGFEMGPEIQINTSVPPPKPVVWAQDMNGDGFCDFLVARYYGVEIAYGSATGLGAKTQYTQLGFVPSAFRTADLDGDGIPDIVMPSINSMQILYGRDIGSTAVQLAMPTYWNTGGSVVLADFNRDGITDLLGPGWYALGNGDGTFGKSTAVSGSYTRAAAGDLNGDGFPDIVFAASASIPKQGSLAVHVLLNNRAGGFEAPRISYPGTGDGNYTGSATANQLLVADVNRDGTTDILVLSTSTSDVVAMVGNGDGTFRTPILSQCPGTGYLLDVNGDGYPDILTSDYTVANRVCYSNRDGSFNLPKAITLGPGPYEGGSYSLVVTGDVNGDGLMDLVAVGKVQNGFQTYVFLSKGGGVYQDPIATPEYISPFALVDVNGDGRLDIVGTPGWAFNDPKPLAVMFGDGYGHFSRPVKYATGGAQLLAVGDLNGDGAIEMIFNGWNRLWTFSLK